MVVGSIFTVVSTSMTSFPSLRYFTSFDYITKDLLHSNFCHLHSSCPISSILLLFYISPSCEFVLTAPLTLGQLSYHPPQINHLPTSLYFNSTNFITQVKNSIHSCLECIKNKTYHYHLRPLVFIVTANQNSCCAVLS